MEETPMTDSRKATLMMKLIIRTLFKKGYEISDQTLRDVSDLANELGATEVEILLLKQEVHAGIMKLFDEKFKAKMEKAKETASKQVKG